MSLVQTGSLTVECPVLTAADLSPPESYLREKHRNWIRKIEAFYKVKITIEAQWKGLAPLPSVLPQDTEPPNSTLHLAHSSGQETPKKKPNSRDLSTTSSAPLPSIAKSEPISLAPTPLIISTSRQECPKSESTQTGAASTFISKLARLTVAAGTHPTSKNA